MRLKCWLAQRRTYDITEPGIKNSAKWRGCHKCDVLCPESFTKVLYRWYPKRTYPRREPITKPLLPNGAWSRNCDCSNFEEIWAFKSPLRDSGGTPLHSNLFGGGSRSFQGFSTDGLERRTYNLSQVSKNSAAGYRFEVVDAERLTNLIGGTQNWTKARAPLTNPLLTKERAEGANSELSTQMARALDFRGGWLFWIIIHFLQFNSFSCISN